MRSDRVGNRDDLPGCTVPGYLSEVDHVEGWANGGLTNIDELTFGRMDPPPHLDTASVKPTTTTTPRAPSPTTKTTRTSESPAVLSARWLSGL
jgi:hypothetical protein